MSSRPKLARTPLLSKFASRESRLTAQSPPRSILSPGAVQRSPQKRSPPKKSHQQKKVTTKKKSPPRKKVAPPTTKAWTAGNRDEENWSIRDDCQVIDKFWLTDLWSLSSTYERRTFLLSRFYVAQHFLVLHRKGGQEIYDDNLISTLLSKFHW